MMKPTTLTISRILFPCLFLPILLLIGISCGKSSREAAITEIRQTEKEFAEMAEKEGIAAAFSYYFADSGVISYGDTILRGRSAVIGHYSHPKYKNARLTWAPEFVDASASGDLGYTYGRYTFTARDSAGTIHESNGIFHTVWKRQADGSWKFVWD